MYTREQLEQMTDHTLEHNARMITQSYAADFYPCTYADHSHEMQAQALRLNGIDYAVHLCQAVGANEFFSLAHYREIVKLLTATPRERTIAALMTLQGRQDEDIVKRVNKIIGRA